MGQVYAADWVALLLKQSGDRYVFGADAPVSDDDPDVFDCSELVRWGANRLGVAPTVPDGSWIQARHCRTLGTLIPVASGLDLQGALLFRFSADPFEGARPADAHVAVSLGNRSTIEARGSRWGVGTWSTFDRRWTHAAMLPGVTYAAPPSAPTPSGPRPPTTECPPWPGRYLIQPAPMLGKDVGDWQRKMFERGWINLIRDGIYGPRSEATCRAFQKEKGLQVDGIVGPATWRAAWLAPVT